MLPSNIKIGIIGGGQLGKMLIEAGKPWNIHYTILEEANAPASSIANKHIVGSLMDYEKIMELAADSDVITYEIEHVNIDALHTLEAQGKRIVPSPKVLEIIQDKGLQKLFFQHHHIPTTDFELVENEEEWSEKLLKVKGETVVAKLRKGGYDGKGVALVNKKEMLAHIRSIPFTEPAVIEEFVEGAIELAVIVSRNESGEINTFPIAEMEFDPQANLVEFLYSPANISDEIEEKAKRIAMDAIIKLQGVGIFAVEMFLDKENNLLVNEIAPRPHNSGHHTIEACYTSQYEQLNRILLGMPLGNTSLIKPAAMINLLGATDVSGAYKITGLEKILATEGVFIHLYNKAETKPKRKMGHITILGTTLEEVKEKVLMVKNTISMKAV